MRKKILIYLAVLLVLTLHAETPATSDSSSKVTVKIMDTTQGGDKTALKAALILHAKCPALDFEVYRKPDPAFSPDITLYDGAPKPGDQLYSIRYIYVTVHPSNPLTNLTLEQLRAICAGRIAEWTKLTGSPFSIHRYALALRAGPDALKAILGKEQHCSFYRAGNPQELYLMTAGNLHAIGICTEAPGHEIKLKIVPIEGKNPGEKDYPLILMRSFTLHHAETAQRAFAAQLTELAREIKKVK